MALSGILVEAHSYSGGLRHIAFPIGGARPAWAPPADSVGWRDDWALEREDAVVEFHQRRHEGEAVSWIAVYRRSVDAQFGDRSNHAGVGVWLHRRRIADARHLLLALDQLTALLAQTTDPGALVEHVGTLMSDRFLGAYLLPADDLPADWQGAPAATGALVDTRYGMVRAPTFAAAVDRIVEPVTRLSLGWNQSEATPRTVILATARATPPVERDLPELEPPGALLADIVERLPTAFAQERDAVRRDAEALAAERAAWEAQCRDERQELERGRRDLQMLDGRPADMEGVAARLNGLSRQMTELREAVRAGPPPIAASPPTSAPVRRQPAVTPPTPPAAPPPAGSWGRSGRNDPGRGGDDWPVLIFWGVVLVALAVVIILLVRALLDR